MLPAIRPIPQQRVALIAILFPCALSACAGHPLRSPDITVPASFASASRTVATPAALDRWWMLFADPQLSELVEAALLHAPDARSALAVLDEARATRAQALSRFNPQGNITSSISRQRSDMSGASFPGLATTSAGATTVYSGAFNPSWEIDLFGRRGAARDAADADLAAAVFRQEAAMQSLSSNVAGNLFEARGLAVRLEEARETRRVARDLANIGRRRVEAGIGSQVDAASLEADFATTEDAVRGLEAQLAVSRRTLVVLIGRGTEALDVVPIQPWLGETPPIPAATPATLLVARPDVREAQAALQSAAGTLKLNERALLPTFNLLPGISRNGVAGSSGYATSLWSLGAGLTLPIFDRQRLLAQARGARARGEQAVIAYEKVVQTAYGEAEQAFVTVAANQDRVAILARAAATAEFAFEAQREGYRAGVVDLTTLLNAERTWRANRQALSAMRATSLRDAVNLFRALGGGWSPDTVGASPASEGKLR